MAYALIDNATLTAAQRLTGKVLTKSIDSIDMDIIALENLVQAILFYDEIIAIDDYIPAHRDERISSFPFIQFLESSTYNLDKISTTATQVASTLRPQIRGGEFADTDFKNLLDLLQTHIVCTWDMSSSIYFLTLKVLAETNSIEFDKYSKLAAAIFSELDDVKESGNTSSGRVELIDRYGQPIRSGYKIPNAKWGDGSTGSNIGAITAFVAALAWLANRSIFYSLAAKYFKADTFLYPIRQAYQQYYISKTCEYGQDYTRNIVKHFSTSLSTDIINIHQGNLSTATAIDLPIFSAWLAKQTGDISTILESALILRNEKMFVESRAQLREIKNYFDTSETSKANKATAAIISDIRKSSEEMRIKYGLSTRQGVPVTRLVHVYNSYAALNDLPVLPDYTFKIPIPQFLRDLSKQIGFRTTYRNLTNDLSTIWSLGEARDILGARVTKDRNAYIYRPKNEIPRYRNSHSSFKSPM